MKYIVLAIVAFLLVGCATTTDVNETNTTLIQTASLVEPAVPEPSLEYIILRDNQVDNNYLNVVSDSTIVFLNLNENETRLYFEDIDALLFPEERFEVVVSDKKTHYFTFGTVQGSVDVE